MSEKKNTIELLTEELSNLKAVRDNYRLALVSSFGEENISEDTSTILGTLGSLIRRTERYIEHAETHEYYVHYWYTYNNDLKEAMERRYKKRSDNIYDALIKLIDHTRRSYGVPRGYDLQFIKDCQDVTIAAWYVFLDPKTGRIRRSKDQSNWLDSFITEPKFSTGDIVSIRANIPDSSIKFMYDWGNGTTDLRIEYNHEGFKKKALMVLCEDNIQSRYYEKTYKPNNNGGMRRYKVLPVGETTVYWVMERALKKNRTKAVKDAKRT